MSDLLTTRQLEEMLQIDRITIYRMIEDGRLKGVKVGNQWRFPRQQVDRLVEGKAEEPDETSSFAKRFPKGCVQSIQDTFAEIAGVGAVTTLPDGQALTEVSNCGPFCRLILGSKMGREGCEASWRILAYQPTGPLPYTTCHAGLLYTRAQITVEDEPVAKLVCGQFYNTTPDPLEEKRRIQMLADNYEIDPEQLAEAARQIPVLPPEQQQKVKEWPIKVAATLGTILNEQAKLTKRLREIAKISAALEE
jgi:excisionase family DNA binding protein